MYYFKVLNDDNSVNYLVTYDVEPNLSAYPQFVEITKDEYDTLFVEIQDKWEEENPTEEETDNISGDEFMQMVEAVL